MKRARLLAALAMSLTGTLAACADGDHGPIAPYEAASLGAYYDGHYGPYRSGYWGMNGYFYYLDMSGFRYRRDREHHFRHDPFAGFSPVPVQAEPEHRRTNARRN